MFRRLLLTAMLLVCFHSARAQQAASPTAQDSAADPQFGGKRETSPQEEKIERDMQKRRNLERQASIKRDTDRLFQLATELKQYVDKTNENTLSLDVIKKAEEVEKLAKEVKNKMKGEM